MNHYLFEYLVDGTETTARVHAADALDAFDQFRADHPDVIISHVWVEFAAAQKVAA